MNQLIDNLYFIVSVLSITALIFKCYVLTNEVEKLKKRKKTRKK